jgi:DNA-directed RNA polymerase specialized sigma24 family protein
LRQECKIWLITVLDKFNPDKGSKAFSYFSVITKNWFIQKVKKNKKRNQREIELQELSKELELKHISVENEYDDEREKEEFWNFLWAEIQTWDTEKLKENEKKVLEAIKILLESPSDIEIFNKKAIYLYMREITGLNTKQIVNSLNKMRKRYRIFKTKWDRGDL